jgi:hypothetical protein
MNFLNLHLESTPKKSSKSTKPISNQPDSNTNTIRRSVKQSKDSSDDQDPVNVNVNVTVFVKNIPANPDNDNSAQRLNKSTKDFDRHTQSDTEQIITEKQKKRRRPKRISRTTQTYERYFRHMDDEQSEELRPTNDRDKSIQTRKSQLRPKPKSPRKLYPVYLSADAFKLFNLFSFFKSSYFYFNFLEFKKSHQNNFLKLNEINPKHQLFLEVFHHKMVNY